MTTTTMTPTLDAVAEYVARSPYAIAHAAGVAEPDSTTSPGAEFIRWTVNHLAERVRWIIEQENDDLTQFEGPADLVATSQLLECIDDSEGTHRTWQIFTDLCGWQLVDEYASDLGGLEGIDGDERTTTGAVCLLALSVAAERIGEHMAETILATI